jgi:hypothetical protein
MANIASPDVALVSYNKDKTYNFNFEFGVPSLFAIAGTTISPLAQQVARLGLTGLKLLGNGTDANRNRMATPNYFDTNGSGFSGATKLAARPDTNNGFMFWGFVSTEGATQDLTGPALEYIGFKITGSSAAEKVVQLVHKNMGGAVATEVVVATYSLGSSDRYVDYRIDYFGNGKFRASCDNNASVTMQLTPPPQNDGSEMFQCHWNVDHPSAGAELIIRETSFGFTPKI